MICIKIKEVLMKIILFFFLVMSISVSASEVSGDIAQEMYNNLKGQEYKAGAITSILVYHLTVRHNESRECQKEETHFTNDDRTETTFKCFIPIIECTDADHKISIQLLRNENSAQILHEGKVFDCNKLDILDSTVSCTAINFETAGALILKIYDNKIGGLEILPAPGSGKIEKHDLTCSVL
jgi:hypothetical protein